MVSSKTLVAIKIAFAILTFFTQNVFGVSTVDSITEFPSYQEIYKIVRAVVKEAQTAWNLTQSLTQREENNLTLIQKLIWPKILQGFAKTHVPIKQLDLSILYRRKPVQLLDTLLGFKSFEEIQQMSRDGKNDPFRNIKLRWIEISSAASQMERFYNKRIKDILHGGQNMREILNSFKSYLTYIWKSKIKTPGSHVTVPYADIPETAYNLMFLEDGMDAFAGLKKLMATKPNILSQQLFHPNSCGPGQEHIFLEPNGNDVPFYLLFYYCLVDVKHFVIQNLMNLYNKIWFQVPFTNQMNLTAQLEVRIRKKVELFDHSLGAELINGGPTYNIHPGITKCDPPPVDPSNSQRNHTYGFSYEKLTNFIKVFVSPETALHKSGTCRVTCDLLDPTYSVCKPNEMDCKQERERECLRDDRCESFNPVCPVGNYLCQNSTGLVSACPSKRFDRLYEYIEGHDKDEEYHFGPRNQTTCSEELEIWRGGWRMEEDVLVDTPHFCEICLCYCFEPLDRLLGSTTTRYFSLRSIRSNFKLNRVVVGIKFHRIRDQIHIAIAEAELLPGDSSKLNQSTVTWIYPKYETEKRYVARLNMDLRSLNLDDIVANDLDRVVTAVRFYTETYAGSVTYNYIGIELLTHQTTSAGIVQGSGVYLRNANSTISRRVYQYGEEPNGPDDPVFGQSAALPDSLSNMYVAFRGTSLEKDAAQSTIPYFDSQRLIASEPSPLRGIGLIHKAQPGYGGFLAFKLIEQKLRM